LFPVLTTLHLGGREVSLRSYGILIAIGLAAGIALAYRRAREDDFAFDRGRVLDGAFWMTVAGLVGSRIVYVVVNAQQYGRACFGAGGPSRTIGAVLADCSKPFQIWEGGLVFYGGVGAAALVGLWFARREGWSFLRVADLFAPALALGHAIGRLGCLAAGCCFGKEAGADYGVTFWPGSVAFEELRSVSAISVGASATPPLHPTQVYEAIGELAIFGALMLFDRRLRLRPGRTFLVYVTAYAVLRFVVEMFRGDVARGYVFAFDTPRLADALHLPVNEPVFLSVGQLGSVLTVLAIATFFAVRRYRTRGLGPPAARTPAP
jgi:phosphatidylglycerol---prolipoprotein diacylglyceryl transferase